MLNIIESFKELEDFYNLFSFSDFSIFSSVSLNPIVHPLNNGTSCLFCNIPKQSKYFALPINHSESTFSVDLSVLRKRISESKGVYVFDKKSFDQLVGSTNTLDIDLLRYLDVGTHFNIEDYDTQAHKFIRNTFYKHTNLNRVIPILKHGERFKNMCSAAESVIGDNLTEPFHHINGELTPILSEIEKNGLFVDSELFVKHFGEEAKKHINSEGLVHSQYFVYTAAGRPSNRFGGINYAALKKDDGCRKSFQSRFGKDGFLVLMDVSASHPRLISQLIGLPFPIDVDPYEFLAKLYFKTNTPTQEQIADAKVQTFQLLYGGVTSEFEHIEYFKKTKAFTENLWETYRRNGFIETPIFKKKIKKGNIEDAYASKLMNYLLQAYETEVYSGVMRNILNYCKNYQSKFVLYTYDSFLFDFSKNDGNDFLKSLKDVVQSNNTLPVRCHKGNNYHEMERFDIY